MTRGVQAFSCVRTPRARSASVLHHPPGRGTRMHIVVTGATGNVGTSVLEALGKEPRVRSITAIARRVPGLRAPKTYFVSADVAEEQLGPIFEGADAVIHPAWQFQPV